MTPTDSQHSGVLAAFSSYLIWGLLPLYWAMLSFLPALDVLMYRILFAFIFMLFLYLFSRDKRIYKQELHWVFKNKKAFYQMSLAACLISVNWFLFIFAVTSDKVIDASLGYYINPLLNVVLAMVFLKEKLSKAEIVAVCSACVGVSILILLSGHIPWASFGMALSFCLYGLIKRTIPLSAKSGLLIETILVTPIAILYLSLLSTTEWNQFNLETIVLLFGAGIATAVPLMLFSYGARRISFSLIGFLQYIAPTSMLILGIFVFGEPFTSVEFLAFLFIWIGLIVFTSSKLLERKKRTLTSSKMN
ncbi:RarD protein [Bacillus sp. JCM 19045]|nr:RarD protein [Bacillus sp. JCM 19045]